MDNSLVFVILKMFYICIVFPFQMRHYLLKRQRRLARLHGREPSLINHSSYTTRNVTYLNSANNNSRTMVPNRSTDNSNNDANGEMIFERVRMPPADTRDSTQWIDENTTVNAAARHQEAEHRQQIIDIQREIEEQASRRLEERQPHPNAPHMPVRLINSSTIRSSVYTINTSGHMTGLSNSSINYPYAPPLTPDSDGIKHLNMPGHLYAKDDGLPSYDQAVTFDSTTTAVTIHRY